jgi:hypothetical protein
MVAEPSGSLGDGVWFRFGDGPRCVAGFRNGDGVRAGESEGEAVLIAGAGIARGMGDDRAEGIEIGEGDRWRPDGSSFSFTSFHHAFSAPVGLTGLTSIRAGTCFCSLACRSLNESPVG